MRFIATLILVAVWLQLPALAQTITTLSGTGAFEYNGDDPTQTAATATLHFPLGLAVDAAGNLYIADSSHHRVRKITPAGVITTVAGDGTPGPEMSRLGAPTAVAVDAAGNLFIADTFNNRIQRVEAGTGTVSTVAGTGSPGLGSDDVAPTLSQLDHPRGIAVDGSGNLYIADTLRNRIRKVTGGIITTVAGSAAGTPGCTGAALNEPRGLAVDAAGDVYIADSRNNRVVKLSGSTVSVLAGSATDCSSGTVDGPVADARFNFVTGVGVTEFGDVLVADAGNHRIRLVTGGTTVVTLSGSTAGFAGDGGPASAALLYEPRGVAGGPAGSMSYYIADFNNHRIRKVAPAAPLAPTLVTALAGNGRADVSFTAGYDGGSPVTSFTASCSPGPVTQAQASSPITVSGLTNNTEYTCSVTATNAFGTSPASNTLTVTPGIPPTITSAAPGGGTVGVSYAHAYEATGTPAPTFAVTGGSLPPGLSLSAAGAISGAPTAAGTFTGTVTASNNVSPVSDQPFSITIAPGPQAINFDPLPDRALGTGPFTLTATGGASGNPVTFTSTTTGTCTTTGANGATLTLVAEGTCTVVASQVGSADYFEAANVQRSFTISIVPTALSLSASSIDFGGQSMGTTSPGRGITVTNTGSAPLLTSSVSSNDPQFTAVHDCGNVAPSATCTITVFFSPAIAAGALNSTVPAAGSLSIASTASGSPHSVALAGVAEKSLVTHYYRSILRRDPDAGGKTFWSDQAQRVAGLGANVNEAWFAMAAAFYNSGEYVALNRNPGEFVTDLYNTFFNRPPDPGGLNFWIDQMSGGMPREVVLVSFMFSGEFAGFTTAIFGNAAVRPELDAVMDFYRGLLSRLPDDGGFNFWVGRFRTAQCQGASAVSVEAESISSQFVYSGEYTARNRNNPQYVGDLYNAFLRRGGDLGGVNFWINQIASGAQTREQVRQQFRNSAEFGARVNAISQAGCQS